MKILLFTKKRILLIVLVIILIIIGFSYFTSVNRTEILLETNSDSITNNEFINRVNSIMDCKEKIAYLTFDDGPNISITPKVLDILKSENVKSTFFVIGKYVDSHPEIVKRAYEEGHYIANHTYSHNNNTLYKNEENFVNEIKRTEQAIGNAIGKENYCSNLFRFPNGYMAPLNKKEKRNAVKLLARMNYAYIDWNCLNNDSMKKYTPIQLLENLKKEMKNKNTLVILMHDTKDVSNSSEILQESIKYIKSQGYEFRNFYNLI